LYYLAFPDDRLLNKILVYSVWLIETTQAMILLSIGWLLYEFSPLMEPGQFALLAGGSEHWQGNAVAWTALPLIGGIGML
jgi:hypothetical protein